MQGPQSRAIKATTIMANIVFHQSAFTKIGPKSRKECFHSTLLLRGFSCHLNPIAQMVKNLPAMQETWVWFLGGEDPLEEGMATHSSILTWRIPMDKGAWWATVCGAAKSQTWLRTKHSIAHVLHRRRAWQPSPVFLPGDSHRQRSLAGYSP